MNDDNADAALIAHLADLIENGHGNPRAKAEYAVRKVREREPEELAALKHDIGRHIAIACAETEEAGRLAEKVAGLEADLLSALRIILNEPAAREPVTGATATALFAVELAVVVLSLVLFGLFLHWFLRWETRLRRYDRINHEIRARERKRGSPGDEL